MDGVPTGQKPAARKLSRRRKLLFRILACTVLPLTVLLALESALWVCGYGYATDFFAAGANGDLFYNPRFGFRFFPRALARTPEHFRVPSPKAPHTQRVVVLGESAAMGYPETAYSFSRILDWMLAESEHGGDFEVYNFAAVAINSHVVREIAADSTRIAPDYYVIFLGNNEVVGPYGPGTAFGRFTPTLGMIRANLALKETCIGQLLQQLSERKVPRKQWEGMSMFLENQIHPADPRLTAVRSHFRSNLKAICESAKSVGAEVLLCTVPVNLKDSPPFASMHGAAWSDALQAQWDQLYQTAVDHQEQGRYPQAVAQYLAAMEIDPAFAELHYRLGQCYAALDQPDAARRAFVAARDCDCLRFRADTQINAAIAEVAESEGVHLLDLAKAFDRDGTCGNQMFLEHVHMTFEGNYAVAKQVFDKLASLQGWRFSDRAAADVTVERCRSRLPYTAFDDHLIRTHVGLLMEQPPFPNQLGHAEASARRVAEWTAFEEQHYARAAQEALLRYREAISQRPDDWILQRDYAELLCGFRNFREAAPLIQKIRQRFPDVAQFEEWQQRNVGEMAARVSELVANDDADAAVAEYDDLLQVATLGGFSHVVAELSERKRRFQQTGDLKWLDLTHQP